MLNDLHNVVDDFCLCKLFGDGLFVNIFAGGGVEPESHYPQWKRVNQGIERYPALIDSIAKLAEGMYIHNNKKQKCSFHVLKTNGVEESDKNKLMCMEIFWLNGSA